MGKSLNIRLKRIHPKRDFNYMNINKHSIIVNQA